jgi:hypothetical protein
VFGNGIFLASGITNRLKDVVAGVNVQQSCIILYLFLL